jgi:hypothetical protein
LPFRNDQVAVDPAKDGTRVFHGPESMISGRRYTKRKCMLQ